MGNVQLQQRETRRTTSNNEQERAEPENKPINNQFSNLLLPIHWLYSVSSSTYNLPPALMKN